MRRLHKLPEPEVLKQNAADWGAQYEADPHNDTKKYRYRHRDIKTALMAETGGKCIYCESKVGHNTPGDVEHKIPSSKRPVMHFAWENLSIACTECNRRKGAHGDEDDPLLDPYNDDVEDLVVHLGPIVGWQASCRRAEVTVRILGLHDDSRMALLSRKIEKIEEVNDVIERREAASGVLRVMLTSRLEEMMDWTAEYSAMVKSVCDAVLKRARAG